MIMIFSILYNFILLLLFLPRLIWDYSKYNNTFKQRLGIDFPKDQTTIWIHAVSVGETKAIVPLANKIHREFPDATFIISSITTTGHNIAKELFPYAKHHVYLPLDFSFIIRPIIKRMKPQLVLLSEGDYWIHFLEACKEQKAKIALLNGKLSLKSLYWYKKLPWFAERIYSCIDVVCVQNEVFADRFHQIGIKEVTITGNLKFDHEPLDISRESRLAYRKKLGIAEDDQVIVFGSSHEPEEKMILDMFSFLWNEFPKLKLLIVPRHPERFHTVHEYIEWYRLPFWKYSQEEQPTGKEKLILVDAMGQLRNCYAIADLAFMGGSFFPGVGGHNLIEACEVGTPILFGPHMESQPGMDQMVLHAKAGVCLTPSDIPDVVSDLLHNNEKRKSMGIAGVELVKNLRGATEKSFHAICSLLVNQGSAIV